MSGKLYFHEGYREVAVLRDGRRVRLRTVLPSDKARLLAGFEQLSTASRRSRFLGAKKRLTIEDLAYLTELDGYHHFALGAAELLGDGTEGGGVGIARFRRIEETPAKAEAAIAILDAWQGVGLGGLLLRRLISAACERDVRTFYTEFLTENTAVRRLLSSICPDMSIQALEPGILSANITLHGGQHRADPA